MRLPESWGKPKKVVRVTTKMNTSPDDIMMIEHIFCTKCKTLVMKGFTRDDLSIENVIMLQCGNMGMMSFKSVDNCENCK